MNKLQELYTRLLAMNVGKKGTSSGITGHPHNELTQQVVNLVIEQAIAQKASDIHIEPIDSDCIRIRYRIDGQLYEVLNIDSSQSQTFLPCLKIMANLETDAMSAKKSQDGRFSQLINDANVDFRVSTFPTIDGEKIAIRILNEDMGLYDLNNIGLDVFDRQQIDKLLQVRSGMILVCGPTGSGKTTTLYALLNKLNSPSRNIVTLEDPVEYKLRGVNQCDIKTKSSFQFADGLKAVLRQDPNVILVGEIRDSQTAEIALRAAITGHLVLSSLHTNSAIGTVLRLTNMGLEDFLVSYALSGAIAQRLVRKICDNCIEKYEMNMEEIRKMHQLYGIAPHIIVAGSSGPAHPQQEGQKIEDQSFIFHRGKGCEECNHTGYNGRIGLYEIVVFGQELREALLRKAPTKEIKEIAVKYGMKSLAKDGLVKVKRGLTTLDEIFPLLVEK